MIQLLQFKTSWLVAAAFLFAMLIGGLTWFFWSTVVLPVAQPPDANAPVALFASRKRVLPVLSAKIAHPVSRPSLLTGAPISAATPTQLAAVMIENTPAARPQMRGLPEAGLVYETLAEGGITRFLAIFDQFALSKVGPVRSARPYFVSWAGEYGGAYAHAGGSAAAIAQIPIESVYDITEGHTALFRDKAFTKPHNLFLDLRVVGAELVETKWQPRVTTPRFARAAQPPAGSTAAPAFTLHFSGADYRVHYAYDPRTQRYARTLGGVPHADADGLPVAPVNIILQFSEWQVLDEKGRLELRTNGEGTAWYFAGGQKWTGLWRHVGDAPTKFVDVAGQPVQLLAGQTFIEILDDPAKVE